MVGETQPPFRITSTVRKGLSCIDNVSMLASTIKLANAQRLDTSVVFFDVAGAFDNIRLNILLRIMHKLAYPIQLINFIVSIISRRSLTGYFASKVIQTRTVVRGIL